MSAYASLGECRLLICSVGCAICYRCIEVIRLTAEWSDGTSAILSEDITADRSSESGP